VLSIFTKRFIASLVSISLLFPSILPAKIIADKSASKSNQPTILKTNNDVIQIDITRPNSHGISVNEYKEFNTPKNGTILNNSDRKIEAKLSGKIDANPRLSKNSAKLIVNKVNSHSKSKLKGNLEIAGKSADLIIANESGIVVDGLNTINSKSTTLTTGKLNLKDGDLAGINVERGEIVISNAGFNDNSEYTKILAKTAKIDADIYANDLEIIAGENEIKFDSGGKTKISPKKNSRNSHKISIDSSALGGMYANKIRLISTKNGVGVKNSGVISADDIVIKANGELSTSGKISSNNLKIEAASKFTNSGKISSKIANIKVRRNRSKISNKAKLEADDLTLRADEISNSNSAQILANNLNSESKSLKNSANSKIKSNKAEIVAEDFANLNSSFESDELNLKSANFINEDAEFKVNSPLIIESEILNNFNSVLLNKENDQESANFPFGSKKKFSKIIARNITNRNSKVTADELNLKIDEIVNENSEISANSIYKNLKKLTNLNSKIDLSSALKFELDSLININSKFTSDGDIMVISKTLDNKSGLISSNKNIALKIAKIKNSGSILAQNDLIFKTLNEVVFEGSLKAGGNLRILSNDKIENHGEILAGSLNLEAVSLKNIGEILAKENLSANLDLLDNASLIKAKNIELNLNTLNNKGEITALNDARLDVKNSASIGKIAARNDLFYSSLGDIIYDGYLRAGNFLNIKTAGLFLGNANLISDKDLKLKAKKVENNAIIFAAGALSLEAKEISNKSEIWGKDVDIKSVLFNNEAKALIYADSELKIHSDIVNNIRSEIVSNGNLLIKAGKIDNLSSLIYSNNDLDIDAINLNNTSLDDVGITSKIDKGTINLKCTSKHCQDAKIEFDNTQIDKLKEQIINEFKNENSGKIPDNEYVENRLNEEIIASTLALFALNLYKDDKLPTKNTNIYSSLEFDYENGVVYVQIPFAHKREQKRKIDYAVTTQVANEDDIRNFTPSKIISNGNLAISNAGILNDKSVIYAADKILLKNASLENISLDLLTHIKTSGEFKYKGKRKHSIGKRVRKGGKFATYESSVSKTVIPAIFASGNLIVGSLVSLKNYSSIAGKMGTNLTDFSTIAQILPDFKDGLKNSDSIKNNFSRVLNLEFSHSAFNENSLKIRNSISLKSIKSRKYANHDAMHKIVSDYYKNGEFNRGSLIFANSGVILSAGQILNNSSTIKSKNIAINAQNIDAKNANFIAKDALGLDANGDLALISSNLRASDIILSAKNIDLKRASEEFVYDHSYGAQNISFVGAKSTILGDFVKITADESLNLSASDINAKENILLFSKNISINPLQSLLKYKFQNRKGYTKVDKTANIVSNLSSKNIALSANDITINSANLKADDMLSINAKNSLNLLSSVNSDYLENFSYDKGFLSKSISLTQTLKQDVISSNLKADKIAINAGDFTTQGANLQADDAIILKADSINLLPQTYRNYSYSYHKKSRFNPLNGLLSLATAGTINNPIYKMSLDEAYNSSLKNHASNLIADSIYINSDNLLINGSNLIASNDAIINAKTATIVNANDEFESYYSHKEKSISLGSLKDNLKRLVPNIKETRAKFDVAKAKSYKFSDSIKESVAVSSNIEADNININADDAIFIAGSNLKAQDKLSLYSQNGDIIISSALNSFKQTTDESFAEALLSITAQNEYAQIAPASKAVIDATKQLERVKKEYSHYKNEQSKLNNQISSLKKQISNETNRVKKSDLQNDLEELIALKDMLSSDEGEYKSNIALASANLASKTAALASQVASAAGSSATYGFSVGVNAEISSRKNSTNSDQIYNTASNLIANDITLVTGKLQDKRSKIDITGSNLFADNDIVIRTDELNINSSVDTLNQSFTSKDTAGNLSYTIYGGGGGSLGLSHDKSSSNFNQITHNNSQIYAGNDIFIDVTNDANFNGANIRADGLGVLNVGGDLNLISQIDTVKSNSGSSGFYAGFGFSNSNYIGSGSGALNPSMSRGVTALASENFNLNSPTRASQTNSIFHKAKGSHYETNSNLSSITADNLLINVGGNTHLKGSLIAAGEFSEDSQEFISNANLLLNTNSLSYENISNISYSKDSSSEFGANISLDKLDHTSANYANNNALNYSKTKTYATIGAGEINIGEISSQTGKNPFSSKEYLESINRDTDKLNANIISANFKQSIDSYIDGRFFTESGRKDTLRDYYISTAINKSLKQIASSNLADISDFFDETNRYYNLYLGIENEIANNPLLADILSNSSVSNEEKGYIISQISDSVLSALGYEKVPTNPMYNLIQGYNGIPVYGHYNDGEMYANLLLIDNNKDLTFTTGKEVARSMMAQDGVFAPGDNDQNIYSTNFADFVADYTDKSLYIINNTNLSSQSYANKALNPSDPFTNILYQNNAKFAMLDKSEGDDLAPIIVAAPLLAVSFSSYLNAPGLEDELRSGPTELAILAPIGTAAFAKEGIIQLAKVTGTKIGTRSLVAGAAIGAGEDIAKQVGKQLYTDYTNTGEINFENIDIDLGSVVYSAYLGRIIVPGLVSSYKRISRAVVSNKKYEQQLKNTKSINRKNKLNDRIKFNNKEIKNSVGFTAGSYAIKEGLRMTLPKEEK